MSLTAEHLRDFIEEKISEPYKSVNVRIKTLPESIGGAVGVQDVSVTNLEVEDDGTLTIVVEN